MRFGLNKILQGASVVALAMSMAPTAHAQAAPGAAAAAASTDDEEIVVTGTSIRGVAPVGSQVVTMDAQAIHATGANSTSMVLAHIPQLSDFGNAPAVFGGNNFQLSVNRPTLRNLGSGVASTAATLFLMDGHRLPGSGVLQTFPDPDVIPASLLQRIEVVPDGGSSVYGSDAVAGVVNFITRNDFDGIQVDIRHGFGDSFDSDDDALTMGKTWEGGSAFIAYSYSHRDPIFGGDRDYVHDLNWLTGTGSRNQCTVPNVTIGATTTALGGGAPVFCDPSRKSDLFSGDERSSVLVGFSQSLSPNFDFGLKAWYTSRDVDSNTGPLRGEVVVAAGSPFSINPGANQTVDFSFAPVRTVTGTTNHLETWGFSPEIKWDLSHDWQFRGFLNYGFSRANTANPNINTRSDLQPAVTAGLINPYNLLDPARLANVNALLDKRVDRGFGEDEITQARGVFDGPLFSLPGGEVHVAFGAEAFSESFKTFSIGNAAALRNAPFTPDKASRDVTAEFAELNVPIIGESNELPFIHSLDLSFSVRHDDYSDFGGVTTKRYGFTYEPVEWIKVAGHWGDSFQAPGLAEIARSSNIFTALPLIPSATLIAPSDAATIAGTPGGVFAYNFFAVQGSSPGLLPQNAEAWDVGIDVTPPILDNNLTFGFTFWNIDYAQRIGSALTFIANPSVYSDFAAKLQHSTAGLSYATAASLYPAAAPLLAALQANGHPLYAIYDFRNTNTGGDRREGLDVRARYTDDTPFGTWFANLDATHFIHYKISPDIGTPFGPDKAGFDSGAPDWRFTATAGVTVGEHWLGQLTWNHSDSVAIEGGLGLSTPGVGDDQTSVDAFNTYDLYAQYDFAGTGLTQDLTFSLGITNITDEDPPLIKRTSGPTAGFFGSTLGRVFQVGVSKHF